MDKVDEALKVLDRVLWRSDGISPEDYADAEIARETLRDELRRLRARDAEWQPRVEKLEAALKGALREHGSCDWNGCWCQDARAALGREA